MKTGRQPPENQFLSTLLTHRQDCVSRQKEVVISSLGHDMIQHQRYQSHIQALDSLCTKRRTGSKTLLGWLNKLGHIISYEETKYVETIFAEDEMLNQLCRSFCLSTIKVIAQYLVSQTFQRFEQSFIIFFFNVLTT